MKTVTVVACLLIAGVAAAQDILPKWTLVPAEQSGLGAADPRLKWPWITPAVDVDGDGDLDFCVYGHHGRKNEKKLGGTWYINDGKGRFTVDRNLDRWDMGTIHGAWYDFSGDGVLDHIAYEARWGTWYLNDGKGNFSVAAKLFYSPPLDVDGDGIFEEFSYGIGRFRKKGSGLVKLGPAVSSVAGKPLPKFTMKMLHPTDTLGIDVMAGLGEKTVPSLGINWCGDINGDGTNDLVIRRKFLRWRDNERAEAMRTWVLLGSQTGKLIVGNAQLGLPDAGKHCFVPVHLDRDGIIDIADVHSGDIFLGDGKGRFTKSAKRLFPDDAKHRAKVYDGDGPVWVADFGNTGVADVFPAFSHGYPKYGGQMAGLFANDGRLGFRRALPNWARDGRRSGFYTSLGDFNGDGTTDAVVIKGQKEVRFYRNEGIPGNHWLKVKVVQKAGCNGALGCKLSVVTPGKDEFVTASQRGTTSGVMHVGLGKVDTVTVRVWFPITRKVVERRDVKADQLITISEGAP